MTRKHFGFLAPLLAGFFIASIQAQPVLAQGKLPPAAIDGRICNAQEITTLTAASDSVTVTQCAHLLETEGAASLDDLTTVEPWDGIVAGQTVRLSLADAAHHFVIKNGSGANLIATPYGTDWPISRLDQLVDLRWTGSQWRVVAPFETLGVQSGGTVAASSNVIAVQGRHRYQLTASDSIQGVDGLADGESVQIIAPASGTTTLVDGASPGSGQAFALSGNDKEISSDDEVIYTLTRVGSEIRLSGGGGGVAGATVLNYAELNSYSVSGLSDGAVITVGGLRGGIFHWLSGDQSGKKSDDPTEGVWVAPSSDETGASGVWERLREKGPGWVNVQWFNADGTDTENDGPEMNAALAFMLASGERGKVYIPCGDWYTDETLDIASIDSGIEGCGSGLPTWVIGTHTDGPVIRVKANRQYVKNLSVTADASTRQLAGSAGTNFGLLIGPADTAGLDANSVQIERVQVTDQPASCFLIVSTTNFLDINLSSGMRCGEHGIQWDNGTRLGYTNNRLASGLASLRNSFFFDNEGHGLLAGSEDDATGNLVVRLEIVNNEFGRNALSAGSRLSISQVHIYGDQMFLRANAFAGEDTLSTAGLRIMGRSDFIEGNRYLEVDPAIVVDNTAEHSSKGIWVRGIGMSGSSQTALDPVVAVVNGPIEDLYVFSGNESYTDSLVPQTLPSLVMPTRVYYTVADGETVNNSTTLTDIDYLGHFMHKYQRLNFKAWLVFTGDSSADIKFAVVSPSGAETRFNTCSGVKVDESNAIVQSNVIVATGTPLVLGTGGAVRRSVELCGQIVTKGTGGDFQLQFAQDVATVADTEVHEHSSMVVW